MCLPVAGEERPDPGDGGESRWVARGWVPSARVARAVDIHSHPIAESFISEVLDRQPPEVVRFMLETSVLEELTAEACTAVTGRQDAAVLLRSIDAASLFLVALDEERTTFRYQALVRQALRAKLRAIRQTRPDKQTPGRHRQRGHTVTWLPWPD